MIEPAIRGDDVAKKKADGQGKRPGTLIRVSADFAEAIRDAASFERVSIADHLDAHFLPLVRKRYREAVIREAKRMEGKG